MRFKDFKEAPQAQQDEPQTFTQQLQSPKKKGPGLMSKMKDKWAASQKRIKIGAGNKPDGTLAGLGNAIAGTAKDIKGALKKDPKQAPAKAQPAKAQQASGGGPRLSGNKIMSPRELKNGSSFVDQKGVQWTYNDQSKGWVPNSQTLRPINAKKGIDLFNLAQTRTKVESKKNSKQSINEAEARIQHAEDLVFFQGSKGALRALEQLKSLAQKGHQNVTIKWDGSPAVIFGRNEKGEFVLTDKSGFGAKGYNGKTTSADDLESMLKARPGYKKNPEGYGAFAANMKRAYPVFEKAVPTDYRGYFKGDMLYFNTPQKDGDAFFFKPNIVQYMVKANSDIGKKIGSSQMGVVIHREVDESGNEHPLKDFSMFQGNALFVIPPVTVSEATQVDENSVAKLSSLINKNASSIDSFLDQNKLRDMKVSDFPQILYTYTNSKVDTGLDSLGRDFLKWLSSSKVSRNKQEKIVQYVKENINTFSAIWDTVNGIMKVKNNIIDQLESQDSDVVATINGQPGGEGYVLADPKGDIKLVNRSGFSAANRAVQR